ncbi:MAG: hypothetical protein CMF42_02500 [Legionellales bacterium]|nr:hypothetical protein [Legionellales bacterium]OUX67650.1 MAG: hypothetical protein CBD38_01365 [bacterium TMED178]
MKLKHTIALSAAMIASASAFAGETFESLHPCGYAIQIGPGFFAPAYYAKNNQYTIGLESFTASFIDNTNGTEDNSWGIGPFARYNFPLTKHTTIGPGLYYAKYFGSVGTQTKEYSVSQYFNLEYAGTKNILLAASLRPVKYTQYNRDATTKNYQIDILGGGSLQISYKF